MKSKTAGSGELSLSHEDTAERCPDTVRPASRPYPQPLRKERQRLNQSNEGDTSRLPVHGWRPATKTTSVTEKPAMKVFTTGQVAKICKVAPRTVSKWFDSGRLKGYRIPGSQDRRIPREYLIKFLKEHGMPLGDLEDEAMAKVLIVGSRSGADREPEAGIAAREVVQGGCGRQRLRSRHSSRKLPSRIRLSSDFSIGRVEALQICQNLRRNPEFAETILIALLPDDGSPMSFDRSSINETFKKPFDAKLSG